MLSRQLFSPTKRMSRRSLSSSVERSAERLSIHTDLFLQRTDRQSDCRPAPPAAPVSVAGQWGNAGAPQEDEPQLSQLERGQSLRSPSVGMKLTTFPIAPAASVVSAAGAAVPFEAGTCSCGRLGGTGRPAIPAAADDRCQTPAQRSMFISTIN